MGIEIERKWLFDTAIAPNIAPLALNHYEQAYLSVNPEVRIVRKSKRTIVNGKMLEPILSCELCIKSKGDIKRIEVEKDITNEEFEQLMVVGNIREIDLIHKECYVYDYRGYVLPIGRTDIFRNTEFIYGEIEYSTVEEADAFIAPSWFGKEVTNDSSYKMCNYWRNTRADNRGLSL